jgi:Putative zinc ribbon domain
MDRAVPDAPQCQSCGMPMQGPADFGTLADGSPSADYCNHCQVDGVFTEPHIAMQAMIDRCTEIVTRMQLLPAPQARALMVETIPTLRRWR